MAPTESKILSALCAGGAGPNRQIVARAPRGGAFRAVATPFCQHWPSRSAPLRALCSGLRADRAGRQAICAVDNRGRGVWRTFRGDPITNLTCYNTLPSFYHEDDFQQRRDWYDNACYTPNQLPALLPFPFGTYGAIAFWCPARAVRRAGGAVGPASAPLERKAGPALFTSSPLVGSTAESRSRTSAP